MPVIIVEKDVLKNILPDNIINNLNKIIGGDVPKEVYEDESLEYITKFRVIPFSSIGKENGMLVGIRADGIEIESEDETKKSDNIIIAIYDKSLTKRGEYRALIGIELI